MKKVMDKKCTLPMQEKMPSIVHQDPETLGLLMERVEEFAHMGNWILHEETDTLHFSRGFCHLIGINSDNHKPGFSQLLKRIHADDRKMVERHYREIKSGLGHDITYRIVRSDGLTIHVKDRCEYQRDSDGNIILTIGFLKNISKVIQQEEAVRKSNKEIDEFAHTASHDLQEPLRAINNFNHLLLKKYAEQLDDTGRDFINRSLHAGRRLEARIRNLLMLSSITTRGKSFNSADLNTIFEESRMKLQPEIESRDAEITVSPLPTLPIDADQMRMLFYHLLMNSLHYNTSSRPIIFVEYHKVGDSHQISVRDNGIGIDKQFHQRIFIVFQRLHTQREYPGEGMGLTIAKKIVERHGGIIWVESEPGNGATVHFTLGEN